MSSARYQLCVVADDVGELVNSAGGWLCDRMMAGWDISVTLPQPHNLRPLHILGITTLLTEEQFTCLTEGGPTASIAIAAGIFDTNHHIRAAVHHALNHPNTEITLWGPTIPTDLHHHLTKRQHRLSNAARAFKTHALAAAALPAAVTPTENHYTTTPQHHTATTRRLVAGQQDGSSF